MALNYESSLLSRNRPLEAAQQALQLGSSNAVTVVTGDLAG